MKKSEKNVGPFSCNYLTQEFTERAIKCIENAECVEASEEFIFGFVCGLGFVSTDPDDDTNGIPAVDFIENGYMHYTDHSEINESVRQIVNALRSAGFECNVTPDAVIGGIR